MKPLKWIKQNHRRRAAFSGIVVALFGFVTSVRDHGVAIAVVAGLVAGVAFATVIGLFDRDPPAHL